MVMEDEKLLMYFLKINSFETVDGKLEYNRYLPTVKKYYCLAVYICKKIIG